MGPKQAGLGGRDTCVHFQGGLRNTAEWLIPAQHRAGLAWSCDVCPWPCSSPSPLQGHPEGSRQAPGQVPPASVVPSTPLSHQTSSDSYSLAFPTTATASPWPCALNWFPFAQGEQGNPRRWGRASHPESSPAAQQGCKGTRARPSGLHSPPPGAPPALLPPQTQGVLILSPFIQTPGPAVSPAASLSCPQVSHGAACLLMKQISALPAHLPPATVPVGTSGPAGRRSPAPHRPSSPEQPPHPPGPSAAGALAGHSRTPAPLGRPSSFPSAETSWLEPQASGPATSVP